MADPLKKRLILLAEILLVLVIIGLLVAIWLPAWFGATPGLGPK
jgi:competence protein ComGC